jgi:hypothetical protein
VEGSLVSYIDCSIHVAIYYLIDTTSVRRFADVATL